MSKSFVLLIIESETWACPKHVYNYVWLCWIRSSSTSDNKIHELPLSTSEFKQTERMLFESSPDPICLYVSTHDSVFISSNVQPVSSLHLSQVELSEK